MSDDLPIKPMPSMSEVPKPKIKRKATSKIAKKVIAKKQSQNYPVRILAIPVVAFTAFSLAILAVVMPVFGGIDSSLRKIREALETKEGSAIKKAKIQKKEETKDVSS